ncbi:MAG: lysyl tRNA synthetase-like protein [Amycolatopsis sp.]|uniref:histone-like nucleoid-structuring protein Lsr2 n=1 Tax=Amycolatopsis sp. TaxID=37632 RepID=UPI00261134D2|nr:Lsr2 family protein [Amycolatopsis sp.]MCU1688040.1 lysyl tRNA synthetase-like protein [Amycolatopsis sp.]
MAQKVHVSMVDDIDGAEAHQSVKFGLDGIEYEIDLSDDNAADLRDSLARFVEYARRTGGRKVQRSAGGGDELLPARRERTQQIRSWARENGYAVSERGRISAEVLDAFTAAETAAEAEPVAKPVSRRAPRKVAAAATSKRGRH